MPAGDKSEQLSRLARHRVQFRLGQYRQPEDYGYDFRQFVSPYTKTAGNLDARVMLVLQDWASDDGLRRRGVDPEIQRLGHDPTLLTNVRLKALLARHLGLSLEETYGTNAFVLIKPNGMSSHIPAADLHQSVDAFTVREIDIVRPGVIVALGHLTGHALRRAGVTVTQLPHPAARISRDAMDRAWRSAFE